jgi:hypothetical protein
MNVSISERATCIVAHLSHSGITPNTLKASLIRTSLRFLGAVKAKKRFFNKKLMHVLAYFSKWVLRLLHM